jgi:tRNA(Ile2) C34 agmatinyltransferase TiaS
VSSMTAATHASEHTIDATTERSAARLFEPHGLTLEDVILGAWEDLVAGGPAECPVCGGSMRTAGGCRNCGSDLS